MSSPLRIGVLGAARIADDGIIDPAKQLGHEVVAVAARDRGRAEAFAAARGMLFRSGERRRGPRVSRGPLARAEAGTDAVVRRSGELGYHAIEVPFAML